MTETSTAPTRSEERAPPESQMVGLWSWLFAGLAIALGALALWSAGPGIAEPHIQLPIYTLLTWVLTLILYPGVRGAVWRAPDPADWLVGVALAGGVAGAILRADAVSADGTGIVDWCLWAIAIVAGAVAVVKPWARNLALIAMSVLTLVYFISQFDALILRPGAWTPTDFWIAATAVIVAIEVGRRGIGAWIPAVAIAMLLYASFGYLISGPLSHRGSSIHQIANYMMYSQEGIFGVMTSVMATYVLIFIYLGAFMERSGMGRFFIDLPMALAGRTAGGPAKVAVMASALFGSISGSSLANIVSTGAFTIPLMKRIGFKPHVAGAVENTSSLGGQLLPPVMGAGVFVMAEITGVPYVEIITIALVPALLYMLSIGLTVHFAAKRAGIRGMRADEVTPVRMVLRQGWFHIIPFAVLVAFLIAGYTPDRCAIMAIASILVINWLRVALAWALPDRFAMPDQVLGPAGIRDAVVVGTNNSLVVGSVAAAVGVIVGVVALTGLGLKMGHLIVGLSSGNLLIAILLVAVASLVLGMALPITASYLVIVVLAGPALQQLGIALLTAHMIVYWLSQDSNVTPPVCLGAYVAASIAVADPWKTGWMSFRFAKMLYVMPLLFAYTPILMTGTPLETAWAMTTALFGTIAFSAWTMAWLYARTTWPEWVLLCAVMVLCFLPAALELPNGVTGWHLNVIGIFGLAALFQMQRMRPPARVSADTASE